MIAVSVMVVFFYVIVKEMFIFAVEHLKNYVIYSIIRPLQYVPGPIGYIADMLIENIKENDALAYQEWTEHGPDYVSIEEIRMRL